MNGRLFFILVTYNNRAATPVTHEARKVLSHKAFRASFTLAAAQYLFNRISLGTVKSFLHFGLQALA